MHPGMFTIFNPKTAGLPCVGSLIVPDYPILGNPLLPDTLDNP